MTEANILKDLPRRKGLVRVRGAFEKFGTAYCVMEFIEGDSLERMAQRVIERHGYVSAELVADLGVAICWALDALHGEHLIHRDVKPANIMLRKTGEPVLIDFGAARRLSLRHEKEMIFTRKFAAIEQFPPEMTGFGRSFEEGPWSDLYSLAVVLYELIALNPPPDAIARAGAVLSGKSDPFMPLAKVVQRQGRADRYPAEVLEAIDAGCALLPKERLRTAEQFARRLVPDAWDKLRLVAEAEADKNRTATYDHDVTSTARTGKWIWLIVLFALTLGGIFWIYRSFYYVEVF